VRQDKWGDLQNRATRLKAAMTCELRECPGFPQLAAGLFSHSAVQGVDSALGEVIDISGRHLLDAYRLMAGEGAPAIPQGLLRRAVKRSTLPRFERYRRAGYFHPNKRSEQKLESVRRLTTSILWKPAAGFGYEAQVSRQLIALAAEQATAADIAAALLCSVLPLFPFYLGEESYDSLRISVESLLADEKLRVQPGELVAAILDCAKLEFVMSKTFQEIQARSGTKFSTLEQRVWEYDAFVHTGSEDEGVEGLAKWLALVTRPPRSPFKEREKDLKKKLRALDAIYQEVTGSPAAKMEFRPKPKTEFPSVLFGERGAGGALNAYQEKAGVDFYDAHNRDASQFNPRSWSHQNGDSPDIWGDPWKDILDLRKKIRWFEDDPIRFLAVIAYTYLDGRDIQEVHARLHGKFLIEAIDQICCTLLAAGQEDRADLFFFNMADRRFCQRAERIELPPSKVHEIIEGAALRLQKHG